MTIAEIQTRLEAVILGTYSAAYPILEGRFRLCSDDRTPENTEASVCERTVQVVISPDRVPSLPVDRISGSALMQYPVAVKVSYVLTRAGDAFDVLSTETGSATRESVAVRAFADRACIESALGDFHNTGGLTAPSIVDLIPLGGSGLDYLADRAILSIPFNLLTRETLSGT